MNRGKFTTAFATASCANYVFSFCKKLNSSMPLDLTPNVNIASPMAPIGSSANKNLPVAGDVKSLIKDLTKSTTIHSLTLKNDNLPGFMAPTKSSTAHAKPRLRGILTSTFGASSRPKSNCCDCDCDEAKPKLVKFNLFKSAYRRSTLLLIFIKAPAKGTSAASRTSAKAKP